MSLIRVPVLFLGRRGEKILYTLFDSGVNISCVNSEFAPLLDDGILLPRARKLATASEGHYMEINKAMLLDFTVNDVTVADEFLIVPGLSEEAIIGAATLQKWRIKLDFEHEEIIIDPRVAKLQLL